MCSSLIAVTSVLRGFRGCMIYDALLPADFTAETTITLPGNARPYNEDPQIHQIAPAAPAPDPLFPSRLSSRVTTMPTMSDKSTF